MPLPTIILPGYFARAIEYRDLEKALTEQGIPTTTVPLQLKDWFPTLGGRSVVPILLKIDQTVKAMRQQHNTAQVNLVAHSAGGWIARIYLGETPYTVHGDVTEAEAVWKAYPYVSTLVTLGTPHVSQERWTKRNLDFVKINYPGAFHADVRYVCVAGKAIYGKRSDGVSWLAYNSYKLTCGQGNCWGDGITPVSAAHLEGATNLTLEAVRHSPRSPKWYGSPEVRQAWVQYLL